MGKLFSRVICIPLEGDNGEMHIHIASFPIGVLDIQMLRLQFQWGIATK